MESRADIIKRINKYYEDYFVFDSVYYDWCAKYEINDTTLFILESIYRHENECTQKYLCQNLSYPKQTVSASLKQLELKGLISRSKDPNDFRGNLIKLTEKGRDFADKVIGEMREVEINAFKSMTLEERNTVEEGLHILARCLKKAFEEA